MQTAVDASLAVDVAAAHGRTVEEVAAALQTGVDGLDPQQAVVRQRRGIAAARRQGVTRRLLGRLVSALTEPLQLLLVAIGVLSAVWGQARDAAAILVVVVLVAAVEAGTEAHAERALSALRSLTAPAARVRRGGGWRTVPAAEVVPGDLLRLRRGDLVPADCRVVAADGLGLDESSLTGEPVTVFKDPRPVPVEAGLAERTCMAYAGTAVVAGEGSALAVATGEDTELGRLGALARAEREPPSPLQRSVAELARAVLVVAIVASVSLPLIGVTQGRGVREMLLSGLALAFATVPEELPLLVTVLLAVGGRRLAGRGALLRRLRAGETLGALTVLVSDKTGTLTENRLRVAAVAGDRRAVLSVAAACATTFDEDDGGTDPLDWALVEAAATAGITLDAVALARYPFDAIRRRMSVLVSDPAGLRVCVKGAPEAVLGRCVLDLAERDQALAEARELAGRGLRVLALADGRPSEWAAGTPAAEVEQNLYYRGLVGFADPLRSGVPDAVRNLAAAGVRTVVVTGDHPSTAAAVAREAAVPAGEVILGAQLDGLDDHALVTRLRDYPVVARATPEDKLRIVRALQAAGEIVAVTGDGVNDAPALAAADVGIAMGQRGTDLAREAADVVLTDDAYPTIAAAIAGGRTIGSQLRRAVGFYLGAKLALIAIMAVPLMLGKPAPFAPVHLVLLELFMDLGVSVAFVCEPSAPAVLSVPPRDPRRRFLDFPQTATIVSIGALLGLAVLAAYAITTNRLDPAAGTAAAVATWLITHVLLAWTLRTRPGLAPSANPAFPTWAAAATLAAVLLAGTPAGASVGLVPLSTTGWTVTLTAAALTIAASAAGRLLLRLDHRL